MWLQTRQLDKTEILPKGATTRNVTKVIMVHQLEIVCAFQVNPSNN